MEVRPQDDIPPPPPAGRMLEVFVKNTTELYCLDWDSDVRLWVRKGDFIGEDIRLYLGA